MEWSFTNDDGAPVAVGSEEAVKGLELGDGIVKRERGK